jgi:hypothetical protein
MCSAEALVHYTAFPDGFCCTIHALMCQCLPTDPLQNYVFFLAQLQNVGYLTTYFTALAVRWALDTRVLPCPAAAVWQFRKSPFKVLANWPHHKC